MEVFGNGPISFESLNFAPITCVYFENGPIDTETILEMAIFVPFIIYLSKQRVNKLVSWRGLRRILSHPTFAFELVGI